MSVDLAWAAGFFDGEGSIFVNNCARVVRRDRPNDPKPVYAITSVSMSISQVRPEPIFRFAAIVGGRCPMGPYTPRGKKSNPYYRWDACGRPSVHRILTLLWPYLSEPKKEQARRVWADLGAKQRPKSPPLPPLPDDERLVS